jgi:8-amino-7-oxononanoate synthase
MQAYQSYCQQRAAQGQLRTLPQTAQHLAHSIVADFSHNDYLGLARDPRLIAAAHQFAQAYGVGATGSRLISGNLPLYEAFEAQIAHAKGTQTALMFNSGYQANATVLAALLDPAVLKHTPIVLSDRLNHASLHDACQLHQIKQYRYRHNDMTHVRELLVKHASSERPTFIVTESVFGMDGDCVDMPTLVALADEFDAIIYIDEAHATGVMGVNGYGLAAGYLGDRHIAMGTFSKALGASGAYVACNQIIKAYLLNRCNGFIYSTALSPAVVGAAQAAWQLLPTLDAQRTALHATAQQLRDTLHAQGWHTGNSTTHLIPLIIGEEARATLLKADLLAHGMIVSAIRPPTVPPHTARIRIALSVLHDARQIQKLIDQLAINF